MGGPRTGAEPQSPARASSPGGSAESGRALGGRSRWAAIATYLLAGVILFTVYLRLSETYTLNSDSANILLMGWDLLHGHLLLPGWYMSDVSFYPTELPQYALLESFLGPHMQTAHVAAAMTYTLTFLLAVVLARSGSSGRVALIRTLIAAGIMLAPQFGLGVFALDLSVGHIGTSVPLLLIWLLLDRFSPAGAGGARGAGGAGGVRGGGQPPRKRGVPGGRPPGLALVPVVTAVLLTWALVADPIVYVVGIGPLGAVATARVVRGFFTDTGHWTDRIAAQWYDLSLGAATVAAVGLAWIVNNLLSALGGFTVNRLPFYLTPWHDLHNSASAGWKVLEVFGANYTGLSGIWLALAFLHMVSVLVVLWALARVARRFFSVSLVDQVLAVAIVLNVALYLLTNAADEAAHEVAIIVPFGAALAARVLTRRAPIASGGTISPRPPLLPSPGGPIPPDPPWEGLPAPPCPPGRVKLAGFAAGILVLAGYTAGLGYEISQPTAPPANTSLGPWLLDHHLTYGLSGYWTSSSVTVESGGRVEIRALMQYTMKRDLWMSNVSWYNPTLHYADFIVLDSRPGFMNHWEPRALIRKYFGRPARTYHTGPYTVLVWNRNLLSSVPR
jgi:hypothetical protein